MFELYGDNRAHPELASEGARPGIRLRVAGDPRLSVLEPPTRKRALEQDPGADLLFHEPRGGADHEIASVEDEDDRAVGVGELLRALADPSHDRVDIEIGGGDVSLGLDDRPQSLAPRGLPLLRLLASGDVEDHALDHPRIPVLVVDRARQLQDPLDGAVLVHHPVLVAQRNIVRVRMHVFIPSANEVVRMM